MTTERAHVTAGTECWCLPLALIPENERRPEPLHSLMPEDVRPEPCRGPRCRFGVMREGVMCDARGTVTFNLLQQDRVALTHTTSDGKVDICPMPIAWIDDPNVSIWQTLEPWLQSLHGDPERPAAAARDITKPVFFEHRLWSLHEEAPTSM